VKSLISVEELLSGSKLALPPVTPPYTEARRKIERTGQQLTFEAEDLPLFELEALDALARDDGIIE